MANVILNVSVIVPEEVALKHAPSGELSCIICETCSMIVPLYRIVEHDKDHREAGE